MQITSKRGDKVLYKIPLSVRWTTLAVVFAIGIGGIGFGVNDALNGVNEREQVQVERCEAGNELRTALVEEKQEELHEIKSHGVPYYRRYLNGTEAEIRQLRKESIEKVQKRLDKYKPEPCKELIE